MIYLSWAIWFKRTSPLTDWTALSCAGHKQEVCHFGNERDYRQVSWTLLSCQSQAWFSIIYCCLQFYVSSSNQAYKSFFTIPTPDNYCKNLKWFACGAAFAWVALLGNNSKLHLYKPPWIRWKKLSGRCGPIDIQCQKMCFSLSITESLHS